MWNSQAHIPEVLSKWIEKCRSKIYLLEQGGKKLQIILCDLLWMFPGEEWDGVQLNLPHNNECGFVGWHRSKGIESLTTLFSIIEQVESQYSSAILICAERINIHPF